MQTENTAKSTDSFIDLRSDTVTKPTPEMWEAMANAEVGDDVYDEDPTVNRLQGMAADMLGKEAALLVPSGTMGNLAALLAHCGRGDEVICGDLAHTFLYEAGGMAALGGIQPRPIRNQPNGTLDLDDIRGAIRADDPHFPITRLITLENTHNRCGGAAITPEYCADVRELADEYGLILHLDGARMFNAAAALGVSPAEVVAPFDSATFCLSKGLSAPVGSVIVGSAAFIRKAHRARKILGGGMRQAGVFAAAGIVALEQMVERLGEDHARARILAARISQLPGILLDLGLPESNMVYFSLGGEVSLTPDEFHAAMAAKGIKFGKTGPRRFRMVTHVWIDDDVLEKVVETFESVLAAA